MASRQEDRLVDIACTIVGETERAYRIDHGDLKTVWVPKSLCEFDETSNTMTMPEWVAIENRII